MSFATLLLAIEAAPAIATVGGRELLQASAHTTDREPTTVVLQCRTDSSCAANFQGFAPGALVIASGDPTLDDEGNSFILALRSICKGYPDQFLNEISITGRLGSPGKEAESGKSAAAGLAINRFKDGSDEVTDWFRIRAFGLNRDKLIELPAGTLLTASGVLEGRTSREKVPFVEIKVRTLRMHAKSGSYNKAEGKEAAGYSNSDFDGSDAPPMPSDWR